MGRFLLLSCNLVSNPDTLITLSSKVTPSAKSLPYLLIPNLVIHFEVFLSKLKY
nr:MAG TPA: hypothetical protein [Bacteriophage sp.]